MKLNKLNVRFEIKIPEGDHSDAAIISRLKNIDAAFGQLSESAKALNGTFDFLDNTQVGWMVTLYNVYEQDTAHNSDVGRDVNNGN